MIKRILVGIGGTPYTTVAIERAVELAKVHDARLTAVSVVDPERICSLGPVPAGAGVFAKRMCENRLKVTRNQIDEAIAELEKSCQKSDIRLHVEWETGNVFDLIIDYARYHDLTVFGLRSIFDYQLVNEPKTDLIRLLSQGVRPILAVSDRIRRIRRVMIAYSGSMESARAMRQFVRFNLWPDAELEIDFFSRRAEDGNRLLKEAAAYCRDHGRTVKTRMIPGRADKRLLSIARDIDADLIVMGNSIRSIWLRKMLGSTMLNTLTRADRPLFLSQ